MRCFNPDPHDSSGGDSSFVPSGMDNDPRADEEIIDQQVGGRNAASSAPAGASVRYRSPRDQYPKPVDELAQNGESPKLVPDDLADSIAYALDGSGPGPTNDVPNVSGHSVITEGTTGAGLEDEEDAMRT